jgi:hypothetical protein
VQRIKQQAACSSASVAPKTHQGANPRQATNRQSGSQTDRQTNRLADKRTSRQMCSILGGDTHAPKISRTVECNAHTCIAARCSSICSVRVSSCDLSAPACVTLASSCAAACCSNRACAASASTESASDCVWPVTHPAQSCLNAYTLQHTQQVSNAVQYDCCMSGRTHVQQFDIPQVHRRWSKISKA